MCEWNFLCIYEKCIQNVGWQTLMEDTKLETLTLMDVNIEIFLKELGSADVHWIQLARDRDQWWVYVNSVMSS
jgi:hypothetical protein